MAPPTLAKAACYFAGIRHSSALLLLCSIAGGLPEQRQDTPGGFAIPPPLANRLEAVAWKGAACSRRWRGQVSKKPFPPGSCMLTAVAVPFFQEAGSSRGLHAHGGGRALQEAGSSSLNAANWSRWARFPPAVF
ncbi:hypothetical protein KSP39_PZI016920 [Platanthera zijinensis]|uniref:Secreted protein n=1 Tax=Platanthera zijinensis TaxID=2320716 RepID=A0AAP0B7A7_9ASPA